MLYGFIILIVVGIFMALKNLFTPMRWGNKEISFDNFIFLGCTYAVIMISFGLLFLLLELHGMHVILDSGAYLPDHFLKKLTTSMYLSAITLFSVGYGDVVPLGWGRIFVMIEAMIGYTIPAAFVVRTVIDYERKDI